MGFRLVTSLVARHKVVIHGIIIIIIIIQGGRKKTCTLFVRLNFIRLNFINIDRFSNLFHCLNQEKIVIILSLKSHHTSSLSLQYTTLGNVSIL